MSEMFDNSVNIIMTFSFIFIILYMLFAMPVQKVFPKPKLVQPDGFKEGLKDCDNIWSRT